MKDIYEDLLEKKLKEMSVKNSPTHEDLQLEKEILKILDEIKKKKEERKKSKRKAIVAFTTLILFTSIVITILTSKCYSKKEITENTNKEHNMIRVLKQKR